MDNMAKFEEFTEYYITFRSITYAQRALSVLESVGIPGTLSRTPQPMARKGCGYSVRLRRSGNEAQVLLAGKGIPYSKIYGMLPEGSFQEITL